MKKGWQKYIIVTAAIFLAAILILLGISQLAVCVTDSLNEKYLTAFKAKERGISSPWYENGYHIVDEGFVEQLDKIDAAHRNIVTIGSSLSLISFRKDELKLPDDYGMVFLVCGNGSWKSDMQLYDLYKLRQGNDQDIVKLEVSFSTFRYVGTTITESVIDKWGRYKIDDKGHVQECSALMAPAYFVNKQLLRIQNMWELGYDAYEQIIARDSSYSEIVPGNFRNNYFNYDQVASGIVIDDEKKQSVLSTIDDISASRTLVVELSPMPPSLLATENGRAVYEYMDKELIPYLEANNIQYFDYRNLYTDDRFCDGLHMDYETGSEYTKLVSENMTKVIESR